MASTNSTFLPNWAKHAERWEATNVLPSAWFELVIRIVFGFESESRRSKARNFEWSLTATELCP